MTIKWPAANDIDASPAEREAWENLEGERDDLAAVNAVLLAALEDFLTAYMPPDDGPLSWEALNDAAEQARVVLATAKGEVEP